MRSAAAIREKIESSLAARIPAALSPCFHQAPELLPTGIAEVDALLEGGLPLGSLTEIVGPNCSGRSTLVASVLAGATRQGASCAYVDGTDAFDPLSGAAVGIKLAHLLWIRAAGTERATICEGVEPTADRQHARRGEVVLHQASAVPIQFDRNSRRSASLPAPQNRLAKEIWTSLDRALRATDLLLNTGGFRVIVLDVGDIRPEQVRRIPLASWHRYRLQAEKSQALFLLLTQTVCANGCASVVLHCKEAKEQWRYATENEDGRPLLTGFQYSISAERKRAFREEPYTFGRKPASSVEASWKRSTLWAR